jgi:hypothetical protein
MIRKLAIAVAAIAALGTASLAVTATSAEAKGFKNHHHGHHGHRGHWRRGFHFYGPEFVSYGEDCLVEKVVETRRGPRVRLINICD